MDNIGQVGRANARERYGREFESHQVRRFSYGSGHSTDNAVSLYRSTFFFFFFKPRYFLFELSPNNDVMELPVGEGPSYDLVVTPPPTYSSLFKYLLKDEPPKYQLVTGRQLVRIFEYTLNTLKNTLEIFD